MKKIYLIIGALVLALALLIGASVIIDQQLEKDTSFIIIDKYDENSTTNEYTITTGNLEGQELTGKYRTTTRKFKVIWETS